MPSAPQRASVSISVPCISRRGHIPIVFSSSVSRAAGIISEVSGSATRLVRMKYCGKVPKYIHAIGPVVNWQDIESAADSHMRFRIPPPSSGHMDLSQGNIHAMPAMAAYES